MTKPQKIILACLAVAALGTAVFFVFVYEPPRLLVIPVTKPLEKAVLPEPPTLPPAPPIKKSDENAVYRSLTLGTTNPASELSAAVGAENVDMVLRINRIDAKYLKSGLTLTVPKDFSDTGALSPFPLELDIANDVPKLLVIAQRVQAFGVYENGKLVKWGPVSTGKKSTPTTNRLFSTNWKGKEVKSSFDDEWILKYNFNIDNFGGIGFHQYEMPGYPASHSCVRMLLDDAMWLYEWAEQWILSADEGTRLAHGTPVIIFGDYAFDVPAPWKVLPTDATATAISLDEIDTQIVKNSDTILVWQTERETVLGQ